MRKTALILIATLPFTAGCLDLDFSGLGQAFSDSFGGVDDQLHRVGGIARADPADRKRRGVIDRAGQPGVDVQGAVVVDRDIAGAEAVLGGCPDAVALVLRVGRVQTRCD